MLLVIPYIYIILPFGLALFLGIKFFISESRKNTIREIISINNKIYNILFISS